MEIIFLAVSFIASAIGAICGIGGGVIIKPILDVFGVLDISAISFLSGCTVLSMSCYSVMKSQINKDSVIDMTISSFLGIGGGPINLVVLYFFFSMETKVAAQNSLYIILLSQISSLVITIFTNTVPSVPSLLLIAMILCGILGSALGRRINSKIRSEIVDKLFKGIMCVIILICIFNMYRFLMVKDILMWYDFDIKFRLFVAKGVSMKFAFFESLRSFYVDNKGIIRNVCVGECCQMKWKLIWKSFISGIRSK